MLKIWHYLNYKDHFHLCVQRETNGFLDVYRRIWEFQVLQSYNWASCDEVASLLSADMF